MKALLSSCLIVDPHLRSSKLGLVLTIETSGMMSKVDHSRFRDLDRIAEAQGCSRGIYPSGAEAGAGYLEHVAVDSRRRSGRPQTFFSVTHGTPSSS